VQLVCAVATSLLLPLVGVPALGASSATVPRLSVCGGVSQLRPSYVLLGCGDGGQFLTRARWSSWTESRAVGTAVWWMNLCEPDCAAGHFRHEVVTVRLFRPRVCRTPRRMLFTRMALAEPHAKAVTVKMPYFSPSRCP
jgi:hypothetical protein